jgi:hypothetical protein
LSKTGGEQVAGAEKPLVRLKYIALWLNTQLKPGVNEIATPTNFERRPPAF